MFGVHRFIAEFLFMRGGCSAPTFREPGDGLNFFQGCPFNTRKHRGIRIDAPGGSVRAASPHTSVRFFGGALIPEGCAKVAKGWLCTPGAEPDQLFLPLLLFTPAG